MDNDALQALIEVFAEVAACDFGFEIFVGRSNNAGVDFY